MSAPTFPMFGTEFGYEPLRSPSRADELHTFYVSGVTGDAALRATAAVVCAVSGVGRALGVTWGPSMPIGQFATLAMDAIHASNVEAREKGDKAPRPLVTGKELISAASALVPALREDCPVFEWEVAEAVGNSPAPPTS